MTSRPWLYENVPDATVSSLAPRLCETQVDAASQGGPAVGDTVRWQGTAKRQRNKVSTGKVIGYQDGDLLVQYSLSLGRGETKTKTVQVKRSRLID